jgi:outer membrane protein TolC
LKGTQLDLEIRRLAIGRRAVERDLTAGVKDAFVTLLQAHEQAKLEGASLEEISGYLDLVMRRARSGIVSKSDILRTEIQRNAARAAADKAYADELAARLLLERAMGIAADTSFAVAGSLKGEEWQVPDSLMQETPDSSFATLDLAMAALQADQSRLDADISRAERHPAIALSADAGILSSVDNLRLPRENRSPFVGASVGMTIGIPVFTWGAIGLRVEQKALAAEIQDVRVHQLARSVESERRRLLIVIRSGRRLSASYETNVRFAEDNYLLTKSRYAGGDALSLEVLTAQQAVTDTRLAALQAEVDCARAATVLEQLLDHE